MSKEEISNLNDQELLAEAKKIKKDSILSAFAIGFMAGIILFSIWKNTLGLFTLIPLYFIWKSFTNSEGKKHNEAVKELIKERGLQ